MTLTRALAIVFGISAVAMGAYAQDAAGDLGVSIAQDGLEQTSKRRAYAGGRDEEDLKVQPSLPQPSRDPDVRTSAASAPPEEPVHD
ncbi:MAG: hypothetical protein AAB250_12245 [Bdellovibrionota bacterium]